MYYLIRFICFLDCLPIFLIKPNENCSHLEAPILPYKIGRCQAIYLLFLQIYLHLFVAFLIGCRIITTSNKQTEKQK